jgi:hypothetical protein
VLYNCCMDKMEKEKNKVVDLAAERARREQEDHVRKQVEGGRTLTEKADVAKFIQEEFIDQGFDPRDVEITFGKKSDSTASASPLKSLQPQGETSKIIPFKKE